MKTNLIFAGLLVAGLITFSLGNRSVAQNQRNHAHWVVIIEEDVVGHEVPNQNGGTSFSYIGTVVGWADRSTNAPAVNNGASLAATIAFLLDQKAEYQIVGRKHFFIKR